MAEKAMINRIQIPIILDLAETFLGDLYAWKLSSTPHTPILYLDDTFLGDL